MEWADSELLEDLKSRKSKPKAIEVAVVAKGKPDADSEDLDESCEMPEDDENSYDKEDQLKRLFKK